MKQTVPARVKVAGGVVLFGALLAVLWLTRLPGPGPHEQPADVVWAIYQNCMAGDHKATARYFLGGPENDAEMRESICRKITQAGSIKSWEVLDQASAGDVLVLRTKNRLEAEDGRILKWTLIQKGGRWLVTEVV